ncbi:MAG: alpha/beta hydrolase [Acidobacteriota bacterium]|jgi:pimeloyl-ACP methyl ester carboxylesterase|nr:alpha/beta hydrolase [Acidobacteriota bacterium]
MKKMLPKVLLAIGILLVVAFIACVWMVWKRPLKVDAMFSRVALGKAGFEKTTIPSPDGRMTVWVGGDGPCMVLLHGAGDQAGAWARMVPPLLDDHKLVIPDLPGHWKSDPRKGPIGVEQLLSGVELVMDSICAGEEAVLVGNSLGAWLAMLYAREYPASVMRLVAINGGAITNVNPAINLFPETREDARATMKALMGPATLPVPDFVLDDVIRHARVGPAGRFLLTLETWGPYLLDGRLDEIVVPVELVWGDGDDLWTLDVAQRLLDGLPRARLHTVHGCGHVPHRECPDKTLEAIETALAMPPPEMTFEEVASDEADP